MAALRPGDADASRATIRELAAAHRDAAARLPNAGGVFHHRAIARLVQRGPQGFAIGSARFEKHANFIVNRTARPARPTSTLIGHVRDTVRTEDQASSWKPRCASSARRRHERRRAVPRRESRPRGGQRSGRIVQ
jgi:UDP-N-acetylenolpyruvoylglucosamine reductase